MPKDAVTLNALSKELHNLLQGGRIDKIYQPESDEITFAVRAKGNSHTLVISASSAQPRLHITTQKKENAYSAPAFCMLLRKHLQGGIIQSVALFNCDRIICITVEAKNELMDKTKFYLMAELMGRYSNIILLDQNHIIVDAIKRIYPEQHSERYILPNLSYPIQPQTKIRLDDITKLKDFFAQNVDLTQSLLLQNISGIGKETALELASSQSPYKMLCTMLDINNSKLFSPCILQENGRLKDYFILPYQTAKGDYLNMSSLNHCLDYFYATYDSIERKKNDTKDLCKLLKRLQLKNENRIKDCNFNIKEADKASEINQIGQLILSNIYQIKQGDNALECYDYYNDKNITIALDIRLSPSQNAQQYFKRYAKLKRAKDIAEKHLVDLYVQRDYLQNIKSSIENCQTKQEFAEIMLELQTLSGGKKTQNKRKKSEKPSAPLRLNIDEFEVFIGKNSQQNVEVTFKIGSANDVWLHAKNYHGSHAIIKGSPSFEVVQKVAGIAAYFSGAKSLDKVEVDYTLRKNVKKITSAYAGLVTYTNHKTVIVRPMPPDNL